MEKKRKKKNEEEEKNDRWSESVKKKERKKKKEEEKVAPGVTLMLLLLLLWLWWVLEFLRSKMSLFVTVGCSGGYGGGCCDENKGMRPDPFHYNLGTLETGQPWSSSP